MKLAKTLVAVAAFAGMAAIAQDAETAALQTAEKESWVPSITMNHSIVKGYYDRGILWDTNTGYEFSLDLNDLFIKNLRLSLFGRLPIEKANGHDWEYYVNGSFKTQLDTNRDDDFDFFGGELAYNYTLRDVKGIGDISFIITYRIQKNADIYSKYTHRYAYPYFESDWNATWNDNGLVEFNHFSMEEDFWGKSKVKRRSEIEQDFSLGLSFDDVPYLTPNAGFTINSHGKYFFQLGVKNSLPCTIISDKLTLNNSLDFYFYGKDFIKYEYAGEANYYFDWFYSYLDPEGTTGIWFDENGTQVSREKTENSPTGEKIHSKAGFKNAVWRTSLDYAYTDNVTFSIYAMMIQQLQALTNHQDTSYVDIHKTGFVFGATVSYRF